MVLLSGVAAIVECEISNDSNTLFLHGKRVVPDFNNAERIPPNQGESYEIWDPQYHLQHRINLFPNYVLFTNGPLIGRDYVFELDWIKYPFDDHINPPPRYTYVVLSGAGSCLRYWRGIHMNTINKVRAYPLIDAK